MKNNRAIKVLLVAALVPGCVLLRCVSPNSGGTETGEGKISAMLHNPGGSPAAHAKVIFYPVNYNPHTGGLGKTASAGSVDSTTTDNNGNYAITLDTGTYNVLANGDSGLAFQDSITVTKGDTVKPPADTLHAPGTIQGIVQLQPGDDARTVFILFMGTHTFTMPTDLVGNFVSDNMAAGHYSVRILTTTPNYKVLDTNLGVIAGTANVLTGPIVLQYTGIPIPEGLRINYDTLKQIVNLSWNKPINGRKVQGYNIYRKRSDSATFVNIKGGVTDTNYSDSTGVQDQTYEYCVAVVDTQNSEGVKSAVDSLRLVGVYQKTQTISSISQPKGICSDKNSLLSVLDNSTLSIINVDTAGTIFAGKNIHDSVGNAVSGLRGVCRDTGGYYYVTSDAGILKYDSSGQYVATFDSAIAPDVPYDIAIDDSTVFVTFSHAVKKYNKQGRFITQWANDEFALGYVREPGGMALSGDTVFVLDEINAQIQIYSKAGAFLSAWGVQGEKDGQFTQAPSKIVFDAPGRLVVAQQTSTALKVQFFTKSGQYLGKFLAGVINDAPQGIALAKNNMLYLTIENQGTSASSISIFRKTSNF